MKNKNLFMVILVAVLSGCAILSSNANAATWYVRDGGGTPDQCTGTTNAVYPGSGSGMPCAFNHPRYAIGWDIDNPQHGAMAGGDTLYIDGDSDINPGQQAQYLIGYDDSGAKGTPDCSPAWPYDCTLANLPGGSATQPTSVIGTGTHKPQLWGNERIWQVLNADNNYITLQWLEITDHDACAYNDPSSGCNYGGPYPYGAWAEDGLYIGGTGLNLTDVYVHGLGRYGVYTDNLGDANFTRVDIIGNGYGGVSTGINATITGTLTWNQPIVEWNGCVEAYPATSIDAPSNYSQCFGQNSGGYGDGIAFGNVGHGGAGNWTITGPGSISFNTQDGLDTLHGNGTGTIQIDKMRFEGNAGNQVKMNAVNSYLTNSIIIGDCGWWYGAAQSSPGFTGGDICRALGDAVLINVTNNSVAQVYNNTIISNGNIALESEDLNGTGCNGSTAIYAKNNIVLGGYAWIDDTNFNGSGGNAQTTFIYNDGSDGNGAGTCGNLVWNEDYNIVSGTKSNNKGCAGAHDKCGSNPGFANAISMGVAGGNANTFYQGNAAASLVTLNSNSPAVATGVTGLSYWNNQNDFHNVTRANPPSIGGLEVNSCAVNSSGCLYNSDCCTGTCTNFACGTSGSTSQPRVTINSPLGNNLTAGSNVTITATASESNGSISNISVYNGSTLLGSSSQSPYNLVLNNLAGGTYNLTAVATDTAGVSVTSTVMTLKSLLASILPSLPVSAITSPANGSTYAAGSNVTITVTASETNGTISNISLYSGSGILLGSKSTSPYNYSATNLLAGSYTFYAVATDANGVPVTSSSVSITVTAAGVAPVITTQPLNATVTSPATTSFAISATGTPAPTYQWMQSVNGGAFTNIAGATSASYTTQATTVSNNGTQYQCVVSNSAGSVTSNAATLTVNQVPVAPGITSQPVNVTVTAPATATFTVSASGTPAPTYQWMQSVNGGAFANIAGATGASYAIPATTVGNSGTEYECVVTNASGIVISNTVTLTVNPASQTQGVVITSPANNASYTQPSPISFTANVTDNGATVVRVDYYANGSIYLGEATSSPYTLNLTSTQPGTYSLTAKATDNAGNVFYSAPVNVVVNPHAAPTVSMISPTNNAQYVPSTDIVLTADANVSGGTITKVDFYSNGWLYLGTVYNSPYSFTWSNVPQGTYSITAKATDSFGWSTMSNGVTMTVTNSSSVPSITGQPVNATVTAPATASFTVSASGVPAPSYQWMQSINGGAFANINGATSASYTSPATTVGNSGTQYECVVSNAAGSVTSNAATLTVNQAQVTPSITNQPVNVTVTAPSTATFTVSATGTPAPAYQWIQSVNGGAFTNIGGATSASYTSSATTVGNSGTQYECVVSNAAGSVTSNAATLTVNQTQVSPSITNQPDDVTVTAPATATFTVAASGTPAPAYQWMKSVNGGAFTNIGGATSASYTSSATTVGNSGTQYECVVSNAAGSVTSNAATLTVNQAQVSPSITNQPDDVTVTAPATATFTVAASGTPAPAYQWMKSVNGGAFTNIGGATSASYTSSATTVGNSGTQYECVVSNAAGSVTSNAATLTVNQAQVSPSITNQPVNLTVTAPSTATFTVSATGTPAPAYQWMQSVNGGAFTNIGGATSASYTSSATTVANSGVQYECVVTNAAGSVTSNAATLTVNQALVAPSITSQPVGVTVTAPATATFTVSATSATIYQWMKSTNGGVYFNYISGARGTSYTTPPTTVDNNNTQYKCIVKNAAGYVESDVVVLTVNPQPPSAPVVALTAPSNNAVFTGPTNINLSATASELNGNITQVQFYNGTTLLGEDSASPYNYSWNNVPAGNYTLIATATDANGVTVSSNAISITVNPLPMIALTSPSAPAVAGLVSVPAATTPVAVPTAITPPVSVPAVSTPVSAPATPVSVPAATTPAPTPTPAAHSSPMVSIASPSEEDGSAVGSNIPVSVNASEANGNITDVSIYYNGNLLTSSSLPSYTYNINNFSAGTYTLTAVATDANGVSTASSPITVNVRPGYRRFL